MFARWARDRTLIALIGAVIVPLLALVYLSGLPDRGRGSLLVILLQVGLVIASVVLFAVFLARFVAQVNARRVRRWLDSAEGRAWLADLPDDERAVFLARLDGEGGIDPARPDDDSSVDSSGPGR